MIIILFLAKGASVLHQDSIILFHQNTKTGMTQCVTPMGMTQEGTLLTMITDTDYLNRDYIHIQKQFP